MKNISRALVRAESLFLHLSGLYFSLKGFVKASSNKRFAWTVEYDEYGNQTIKFFNSIKKCPGWAKSMWRSAFGNH